MNATEIANLALKSLIHEVSLAPKPGLVDPIDNGSHSDMDYFMFLDSCFSLQPGFVIYYETGISHSGTPRQLFDEIRSIGRANEAAMFSVTDHVNTHKGANFIFGVVLAALGNLGTPTLDELSQMIRRMTVGLVKEELESLTVYTTHGERIFEQFGYTGIRGEVENGLPTIMKHALPILSDELIPYQKRLKLALLEIIKFNDDANMLKRGGIEGLNYGKSLADTPYDDLDYHLRMMNYEFIKRNLSPGGSADLLAVAIFLHHYQICV
ncbi:triphosphoribosyl-dephospho-CoA synthase CitG [Erysipelothrix sp. HDW6C]|uniref:triphosphoribosyl-dephospho-CoA synthase CitG n=1 Tax=Erysipelothrix sp. HDW6C TaxID=2714930 RepID=UPI00140954D3|nr:triphosphoribosyl-dephospho-CoA synthase CitG [Erysipelothrix sp. HDW6C]QIK69604.1 triphosphoribosyl-dephospho-CoA synthase CitG [Erysipelothrix sp. HDW6C]